MKTFDKFAGFVGSFFFIVAGVPGLIGSIAAAAMGDEAPGYVLLWSLAGVGFGLGGLILVEVVHLIELLAEQRRAQRPRPGQRYRFGSVELPDLRPKDVSDMEPVHARPGQLRPMVHLAEGPEAQRLGWQPRLCVCPNCGMGVDVVAPGPYTCPSCHKQLVGRAEPGARAVDRLDLLR